MTKQNFIEKYELRKLQIESELPKYVRDVITHAHLMHSLVLISDILDDCKKLNESSELSTSSESERLIAYEKWRSKRKVNFGVEDNVGEYLEQLDRNCG